MKQEFNGPVVVEPIRATTKADYIVSSSRHMGDCHGAGK
jgi:hypothetical protein